MTDELHFKRLEQMYLSAPTNQYYSPSIEISEGEAEVVIPIRSDFFHGMDAVHGSVYFKALDDSAFFAVNSLVMDVFVLTVSFSVYLLRPISSGEMRARGKVVHRSQRLYIAESEAFDSRGRQVARGHGTFMPSTIQLNKQVGYPEEVER